VHNLGLATKAVVENHWFIHEDVIEFIDIIYSDQWLTINPMHKYHVQFQKNQTRIIDSYSKPFNFIETVLIVLAG